MGTSDQELNEEVERAGIDYDLLDESGPASLIILFLKLLQRLLVAAIKTSTFHVFFDLLVTSKEGECQNLIINFLKNVLFRRLNQK